MYCKRGQEPENDRAHFVVHPGWTPRNHHRDWEQDGRKEPFLRNRWQDYVLELGETLDESIRKEEPVHVFYDSGSKSHTETLLEKITEEVLEVEAYTRIEEDDHYIPERYQNQVQTTLKQLPKKGEMVVHGEIMGRCVFNIGTDLPEIREGDYSSEAVNYGTTFPQRPTWEYRTGDI